MTTDFLHPTGGIRRSLPRLRRVVLCRASIVAVAILALQFLVEVTQAHTWKGTPMTVKVFAMALGALGLAAAASVLVERLRRRRLATVPPEDQELGARRSIASP